MERIAKEETKHTLSKANKCCDVKVLRTTKSATTRDKVQDNQLSITYLRLRGSQDEPFIERRTLRNISCTSLQKYRALAYCEFCPPGPINV